MDEETVNILLVDDTPENLDLLEAILAHPGYNLVKALSGAAALDLIQEQDFALVLLDVYMPVIDGFKVARLIKEREQSRDIPIIFLTAVGADEKFIAKGYSAGAVDYVVKPFEPAILKSKVGVFVDLCRKNRQLQRLNRDLRETGRKLEEANAALRSLNETLDMRVAERTAALKETEDRYRGLVELAPDGVVIQSEGKILFTNGPGARIFGAESKEQLAGRSMLDFVHPEYKEIVRERVRTMIETGAPAPLTEEKLLRLDGSVIVVEAASTPFVYQGRPATQTWFRDVTWRKQAEESLRESQEHYRTLVEMSPDGIAVHSGGKIVLVNDTTVKIVGAESPEQLVGRSIWDFVHPDYRQLAAARIRIVMEKKKPMPFIEEVLLKLDGTPIIVEAASTVITHKGKPAVQTWLRDLTWRKQAEDKLNRAMADLERSNKDLEQFAYAVSHDLREPLRMVTSFTQLLAKRHRDKLDKDASEFMDFIVDGSARMNRMIEDLLEFSRVGTRGKSPEPADCEAAMAEALKNLKVAIEESGAVVSHDPLPTIMADIAQIARLFQNLVGNAIKFRREEAPRVHISAERKENEWVFSVRDNGIGVAAEDFPQLFQVFSRLHARDKYPGTGVGLAVCKRIVECHGGRLWVESKVGKGSTFYFTIPVARLGEHR
ncbi:MAG: PAS domain S-box protein [Chloroflexi bacterium]|nr:PAS domain S-box protein [Chloroflexota bacterium]